MLTPLPGATPMKPGSAVSKVLLLVLGLAGIGFGAVGLLESRVLA